LIQLGRHEEALNMLFIINPDLDDVFSYYFELAIAKKVTRQKVSKELLENYRKCQASFENPFASHFYSTKNSSIIMDELSCLYSITKTGIKI
ncbi:MAG: hypothetical protein R3328_06180, partial [Planococcaceae bacterium]|nr:hypothetical protein [Planococcaceae bacterium]